MDFSQVRELKIPNSGRNAYVLNISKDGQTLWSHNGGDRRLIFDIAQYEGISETEDLVRDGLLSDTQTGFMLILKGLNSEVAYTFQQTGSEETELREGRTYQLGILNNIVWKSGDEVLGKIQVAIRQNQSDNKFRVDAWIQPGNSGSAYFPDTMIIQKFGL